MKLVYMQLISDMPIEIEGIGSIKPIKLNDIKKFGEDTYYQYLNAIYTLKNSELFEEMMENPTMEGAVKTVLSFFVDFKESYIMTKSSLIDVCDTILQLCFVNGDEPSQYGKPKNKRAEEIIAKLQAANLNMKNKDKSNNLSFAEMAAAICGYHCGYTLLNVWGLTVFQLYDQFVRICNQIDFNISSMRWAAYGTEEFDTTAWSKNALNKME